MTKLHQISKDYIGFLDSDIPTESLNECLESIEGAFEDKGSNIVAVVNTLQSDVDAISNEIKRLQDRKKSIVNNQDRLKEYLRYNMEVSGITKINHPLFNITLGKPSVVADVTDADLLPDEYVKLETKITPDKVKIKKALKEGIEIEGAQLSEGKSRLLIK